MGMLAVIVAILSLIAGGLMADPHPATVAYFYSRALMAEFAFGIIIGVLYSQLAATRNFRWPAVLTIMVASILVVVAFWFWPGVNRMIAYGLPAAFILAAAIKLEACGWVIRNRTIQLLGAATYAIYLTHFFVMGTFIRIGKSMHLHGVFPHLAMILFGTVVLTIVGVLTHLLVEKPLIRLTKAAFAWRPGRLTHA